MKEINAPICTVYFFIFLTLENVFKNLSRDEVMCSQMVSGLSGNNTEK